MARSKPKVPMPASVRAKQFAPFSALKGLDEAIAAKEKIVVPRRELSEDMISEINKKLCVLEKGVVVTVVYYGTYEQNYLQLTGPVARIDNFWHTLQIGNVEIGFSEIMDIVLCA